mgnify:CR=1 FL=1
MYDKLIGIPIIEMLEELDIEIKNLTEMNELLLLEHEEEIEKEIFLDLCKILIKFHKIKIFIINRH